MASKQPRIVIVGAGMAGLSAAEYLVKQGLTNVVVLEAADRIGGRIHTVPLGDGPFPIELGANWIQGATQENATFALAETLGVMRPYRLNNRYSCRFMREDGTEIDRDTVKEALHTFQKTERTARSLVPNELEESRSKDHTTPVSLQSVLDRLLKHEIIEYGKSHPNNHEMIEDMKRAFNVMKNHLEFHSGDELHKVAWEEDFEDMMGGDIHIPGGYNQLLNHLLNRLPKDSLQLNSEVVKIKTSQEHRSIEVSFLDGKTMAADHVIVTCSLGYLKKHHASLFEPSLPEEKIGAINRLGFGRVNKIFLEFDRPVTSPTYRSIAFAWNHTHIGTDKTEWFRKLFGFDQVFTRDTTLLGWIAGDAAEHMEKLSDKEIGDTCFNLLRKFLKDDSMPYPKKVLVSRWCSNPYALGVYSYTTPNLKPEDNERLSEPVCSAVGEPKILFAGEATVKDEAGCTHGARAAGIREAQRLCDLHLKSRVQAKM